MDRRSALTTLLSPALAALWRRAAADAPEMRITRIDTIYWESRDDAPFWPHWTWVRLHTDMSVESQGIRSLNAECLETESDCEGCDEGAQPPSSSDTPNAAGE